MVNCSSYLKELEKNIDKLTETGLFLAEDNDFQEIQDKYEILKTYFMPIDIAKNPDYIDRDSLNEFQSIKSLLDNKNQAIIGRKGTGKSSYLAILYFEYLENHKNIIPIYVDLKFLYQTTNSDDNLDDTNKIIIFNDLYQKIVRSLKIYIEILEHKNEKKQEKYEKVFRYLSEHEDPDYFLIESKIQKELQIKKNSTEESDNYNRIAQKIIKENKNSLKNYHDIMLLLKEFNLIYKKECLGLFSKSKKIDFMFLLDEYSEFLNYQKKEISDYIYQNFLSNIAIKKNFGDYGIYCGFKIATYRDIDLLASNGIKMDLQKEVKSRLYLDLHQYLGIDGINKKKNDLEKGQRQLIEGLVNRLLKSTNKLIKIENIFSKELLEERKRKPPLYIEILQKSTSAIPREIGHILKKAISESLSLKGGPPISKENLIKGVNDRFGDITNQIETNPEQKKLFDGIKKIFINKVENTHTNELYFQYSESDELFKQSSQEFHELENYAIYFPVSFTIKEQKREVLCQYHPGFAYEKKKDFLEFSFDISNKGYLNLSEYEEIWDKIYLPDLFCPNDKKHKDFSYLEVADTWYCKTCSEPKKLRFVELIQNPNFEKPKQNKFDQLKQFIFQTNLRKELYYEIVSYIYVRLQKEEKSILAGELLDQFKLTMSKMNYFLNYLQKKDIIIVDGDFFNIIDCDYNSVITLNIKYENEDWKKIQN